MAEALARSLGDNGRATLHLRLGEILAQRPPTPETVTSIAHHLWQASRARPVPGALEAVERAAVVARGSGAYDTAVRYYARALELVRSDARRSLSLRIALGETAYLSGQVHLARRTLEQAHADAVAAGDEARAALAAIAMQRTTRFGSVDPQVIHRLEAAVEANLSASLRRRVCVALATALWTVAEQVERRTMLAHEAVELARREDDPEALLEAWCAYARAIWSPDLLEERLEVAAELAALAPRVADPGLRFQAQRWRINAYWEAGEGALADGALSDYVTAGEELGTPEARMDIALRKLTRAQIVGDFAAADGLIEEMRRHGQEAGDPLIDHYVVYGRFYPALQRGDRATLKQDLPALERAGQLWSIFPAASYLRALGYLHTGRTDLAEACLEEPVMHEGARARWGLPHRLAMEGIIAMAVDKRERVAEIMGALERYRTHYLWMGVGYPLGPAALHLAEMKLSLGDRSGAAEDLRLAQRVAGAMGDTPRLETIARLLSEIGAVSIEAATESNAPSYLGLEGDTWRGAFRGRVVELRNMKGLEYLATLIERAPAEIHVLELTGSMDVSGPRLDGDLGPRLDANAKREYQARARELRAELEDAKTSNDIGREERVRRELEFLVDELATAVGLGGRDRASGSASERARVAVKKAIKRALDKVAAADERLAAHLRNAIRTGTFCVYTPEPGFRIIIRR